MALSAGLLTGAEHRPVTKDFYPPHFVRSGGFLFMLGLPVPWALVLPATYRIQGSLEDQREALIIQSLPVAITL